MVPPCVPLVFFNEMPPQKILAMSDELCVDGRVTYWCGRSGADSAQNLVWIRLAEHHADRVNRLVTVRRVSIEKAA